MSAPVAGGPMTARVLHLVSVRVAARVAAAERYTAPARGRTVIRPVRDRVNGLPVVGGVVVPEVLPVGAEPLMVYGDPATRRPLPTDPATWQGVETRAAAAAVSRDRLAAVTARSEGSAVRAYRSRKGVSWPGFTPVTRGDARPVAATLVYSLGLKPARTVPEVRDWQAFDPRGAFLAHDVVAAATVPHRFTVDCPPCTCGAGGPDRCVCGYAAARRSGVLPCTCGAARDAVCHDKDHAVDPCETGRVIALRVTQARKLHASIEARIIRIPVPRA